MRSRKVISQSLALILSMVYGLSLVSCKSEKQGEEDGKTQNSNTGVQVEVHTNKGTDDLTSATDGTQLNVFVKSDDEIVFEKNLFSFWVVEPDVITEESLSGNGREEINMYGGLLYIFPQGGCLEGLFDGTDTTADTNTLRQKNISKLYDILSVTGCGDNFTIQNLIGDVYNTGGFFVSLTFRPDGLIDNCTMQIQDGVDTYPIALDNSDVEEEKMESLTDTLNLIEIELSGSHLWLYNPIYCSNQKLGDFFTYENFFEFNTFSLTPKSSTLLSATSFLPPTKGGLYIPANVCIDGNAVFGASIDTGICQFWYTTSELSCSENAMPFTLMCGEQSVDFTIDFETLKGKIPDLNNLNFE